MDIGAVSFKEKNGTEVVIYPQGGWANIDFDGFTLEEDTDMIVYKPKKVSRKSEISMLDIATSVDRKKILRLRETVMYTCRKRTDDNRDSRLISNELFFPNERNNKFLKVIRDQDVFSFRFINYLGRTHLKNTNDEIVADFEIVPRKMDYEEDYIELTKKLADECAEILLEYAGVTSNRFSVANTDNSKTLLEQFIFLREFCYSHNLQALFRSIKRNPDRLLVEDDVLKPVGQGIPSAKFYASPFTHSRGWQIVAGRPIPQEVTVTRKFDSVDTVANRFVKYALKKFKLICQKLCSSIDKFQNGKSGQNMFMECYREATEIGRSTDDILRDHFFDDVRDLDIMPQNNQVLEKREGYRQIFMASAMVDLALQLNWEGEQEAYNGESKNTALLYEYWLFFELRKIISSIDDCECIQTTKEPFINTDDGLTISLNEGQTSCQSFLLRNIKIRVNLYYNKTFITEEFSNTKYAGSYSRPFRPDYTLEIYPSEYIKPEDAIREGSVSYIHFDAKYRITDLRSFIGPDESEMSKERIREEVEEDKQDSITNTYKRGDLLKMHTYNNAIRRSVGSYVLYPGDFDASRTQNYRLYEEVLPGVGAFAIKPSIQSESEDALKFFITEILEARSRKYSRLNRMLTWNNSILNEPVISTLDKRTTGKEKDNKNIHDDLCAVGYIRPDYYNTLDKAGLLVPGRVFIFYYYAIKGEAVYSHHEDIGKAKYFRLYQNNISASGTYEIEPVVGVIKSRELVSRKQLDEKLTEVGCNDGKQRSADFYYVLTIETVNCKTQHISCKTVSMNGINKNDTFSPHSPKVVTESWLSEVVTRAGEIK